MRCFIVALVFSALAMGGSAKLALKGPATAMAGLEGEACGPDEHARYKAIVCSVSETCKCVDSSKCELDWCVSYLFEWRKDFGACVKKGC